MKNLKDQSSVYSTLVMLALVSACGQQYGIGSINYPPVALANPPAVCAPFGDTTDVNPNGPQIVANLFGDAGRAPTKVSDFFVMDGSNFKYLLNATVYFNNLNAPERPFSSGFSTKGGDTIKNPADGKTLTEYFAMKMSSRIKLGAADQEGNYQFAIVSDDGAMFYVNDNRELMLSNDGVHQPRSACATRSVNMSSGTRMPFELQYFQGPANHIALSLLWRKVSANASAADLNEASCGKVLWEAPNSGHSGEYTAFLKEGGWQPLRADNFELPAGTSNPCATK